MKLTDRKNAKELDFEQDGYPVRYAIMDIKEGEKSLCYVSAKCYQIAQQEVTSPTGKKLIGYDVVFDWDVSGKENIKPEFKDGKCINSTLVMKVFTNFLECEKLADFANLLVLGLRAKKRIVTLKMFAVNILKRLNRGRIRRTVI